MKQKYYSTTLSFFFSLVIYNLHAQNVGIGTTIPDAKLHVEQSASDPLTTLGIIAHAVNTGSGRAAGISGRASGSNTNQKTGVSGVALGTSGLNIGIFGSGIGINPSGNNYGLFGTAYDGATNWAGYFQQGNVHIENNLGIGNLTPVFKLDAKSDLETVGNFTNTKVNSDYYGVNGTCLNTPNWGYGVRGAGGYVGVYGESTLAGGGNRFGVRGYAMNGSTNHGLYGEARNGDAAYGVFATAIGGTSANYAGFFSGNVYATGSYLPSDEKLKTGIQTFNGALSIIVQLQPKTYQYKTNEFSQMNLPTGLRYGLVADEVKEVLPGLVTKAIQPAKYENNDEKKGQKLSDDVEFNAVNYTELIPILIGAVKEQNQLINQLRKEVEELKKNKTTIR